MHVAVIGGGASGLMAALTAAECGHFVTLFERQSRVGRKLLATGNGRCNLSNLSLRPENYHGEVRDFALGALRQFDAQAARAFFYSLGLVTVSEPGGRLYPLSDQAGSVVDVLRFAAEARGVHLCAPAEVLSVWREKRGFCLQTAETRAYFDKVIVCCGGLAGSKLGGSRSGYELLRAFGHSCTKLYPALVQLKTDTQFVRSLKGVRADGAVRLLRDGQLLAQSAGEIQFTDYGLSGPAIFEISRAASTASGSPVVHLNLMRETEQAELVRLLRARQRDFPGLTAENLLTGLVHNRLGRVLLRYAGFSLNAPIGELDASALARVAQAVGDFALPVTGTMGFENAQVTAGGIRTSEFRADTLESRLVPGLYAAGEVLDVDGDCGGYNLQWAWASGRLAGRLL